MRIDRILNRIILAVGLCGGVAIVCDYHAWTVALVSIGIVLTILIANVVRAEYEERGILALIAAVGKADRNGRVVAAERDSK